MFWYLGYYGDGLMRLSLQEKHPKKHSEWAALQNVAFSTQQLGCCHKQADFKATLASLWLARCKYMQVNRKGLNSPQEAI